MRAQHSGFSSDLCDSITIGAAGVITIDVNHHGVGATEDVQLTLTPTGTDSAVTWTCPTVTGQMHTPGSRR